MTIKRISHRMRQLHSYTYHYVCEDCGEKHEHILRVRRKDNCGKKVCFECLATRVKVKAQKQRDALKKKGKK